MPNFSFLGGQEVGEKTFSGWPAKPDINANLSPAWISLAKKLVKNFFRSKYSTGKKNLVKKNVR